MTLDLPREQAWRLGVYILARITHVTVADSLGSGVKEGDQAKLAPDKKRLGLLTDIRT
jgi:hypothetical protein